MIFRSPLRLFTIDNPILERTSDFERYVERTKKCVMVFMKCWWFRVAQHRELCAPLRLGRHQTRVPIWDSTFFEKCLSYLRAYAASFLNFVRFHVTLFRLAYQGKDPGRTLGSANRQRFADPGWRFADPDSGVLLIRRAFCRSGRHLVDPAGVLLIWSNISAADPAFRPQLYWHFGLESSKKSEFLLVQVQGSQPFKSGYLRI